MAKLLSAFVLLILVLPPGTSHQLALKDEFNILRSGSGKLHCSSKTSTFLDQGVYWFHQKSAKEPPTFLFYMNSLGKKTSSSRNAEQFAGQKDSRGYNLEFKAFDHSQQSTYYCLSIYNSEIYFSPGIPLYYPVTRAPTTLSRSTAVDPKPSSAGSGENCTRQKPPDTTEKRVSGIPCEWFIWVPLAGACLILLIVTLITSTILCKYSRRKRCQQYCKCRKRYIKENNGRVNSPDRYA